MKFLLSHWHCILPVVGIIAAVFFMRNKLKDRAKDKSLDYDDN